MKQTIIFITFYILVTAGFITVSCEKNDKLTTFESTNAKDIKTITPDVFSNVQVSSVFGNNQYAELNIERTEDGTVYIETNIQNMPDNAERLVHIFDYDVEVVDQSIVIEIPDSDQPVWLVPMNPDLLPMQVGGGSGGNEPKKVTVKCHCTGQEGKCDVNKTTSGNKITIDCISNSENPCSGCCEQSTTTELLTAEFHDTYILISANELHVHDDVYTSN